MINNVNPYGGHVATLHALHREQDAHQGVIQQCAKCQWLESNDSYWLKSSDLHWLI